MTSMEKKYQTRKSLPSLKSTPCISQCSELERQARYPTPRPAKQKGPMLPSTSTSHDPLKAFPTELSQRIFSKLHIRDLASCALVSKKWARSPSLNYVWFQYYRKEHFDDDSLPPWTKRESKQNWRQVYLKAIEERSPKPSSFSRGYKTTRELREEQWKLQIERPLLSTGYKNTRELKEEQWKLEAQVANPGKVGMRERYRRLEGRKARAKVGKSITDKGGWNEDGS